MLPSLSLPPSFRFSPSRLVHSLSLSPRSATLCCVRSPSLSPGTHGPMRVHTGCLAAAEHARTHVHTRTRADVIARALHRLRYRGVYDAAVWTFRLGRPFEFFVPRREIWKGGDEWSIERPSSGHAAIVDSRGGDSRE